MTRHILDGELRERTDIEYGRDAGPAFDVEAAIQKAKAEGYEVVRSNDRTLLLDLDGPAAIAQYVRTLPVLQEVYGMTESDRWPSKSGNVHVVVALKHAMKFRIRVGLQAILGSDPVREALALKRYEAGQYEPSVLFRPRRKS